MRILRWKAWPATSSCSAIPPGASRASKWAGCAWKMRMARRRTFLFGEGGALAYEQSFPRRWPTFAGKSLEGAQRPAVRTAMAQQECGLDATRRAASRGIRIERPRCSRHGPHAHHHRRRTVFRRERRHATRHSRAVRGRINKAWGLALRKRFCVTFDFELQAAATDNGLVISLGEKHSFPLESVFGYLPSHTVREVSFMPSWPRPCSPHAGVGTLRGPGAPSFFEWQESPAADSTDESRGSLGGGLPRCHCLSGQYDGRAGAPDLTIRWSRRRCAIV